jgi:hypothetical protein
MPRGEGVLACYSHSAPDKATTSWGDVTAWAAKLFSVYRDKRKTANSEQSNLLVQSICKPRAKPHRAVNSSLYLYDNKAINSTSHPTTPTVLPLNNHFYHVKIARTGKFYIVKNAQLSVLTLSRDCFLLCLLPFLVRFSYQMIGIHCPTPAHLPATGHRNPPATSMWLQF